MNVITLAELKLLVQTFCCQLGHSQSFNFILLLVKLLAGLQKLDFKVGPIVTEVLIFAGELVSLILGDKRALKLLAGFLKTLDLGLALIKLVKTVVVVLLKLEVQGYRA